MFSNINSQNISNLNKPFFFALVLFLTFTLSLFLGVKTVDAATLYFSPSSGSQTVGNVMNVNVLVDTEGQTINSADATITYPSNFLEVISISKSGSIFSLWVEEPTFSNTSGTINLSGGLPTPGYNGGAGRIVSIAFRLKNAGSASLIFSSGSVRANDGLGTDILQSLNSANFSISAPAKVEPPVKVEPEESSVVGVPSAPKITSSTHPDSDKWYNNKNPVFSWALPSGTDAVETLISDSSASNPTILYIPPIDEKKVEDMEDGSWYFHLRLRNENGWGAITRFRFQIDTVAPSLSIQEIERDDLTDPRVRFVFDAEDETSGIDYYEVNINGKKERWEDDGSGIFETGRLDPGTYNIKVKAFDYALNSDEASGVFEVKALNAPTISLREEGVDDDKIFVIEGQTEYLNAKALIFVEKWREDPSIYRLDPDGEGQFSIRVTKGDSSDQVSTNEVENGDLVYLKGRAYRAWIIIEDERGARSNPSEEVSFKIQGFSFFDFGSKAITVLSVLIPLIILLVLLIGVLFWGWYQITLWRGRLKKEMMALGLGAKETLDKFKKDVEKKISKLKEIKTKGKTAKKKKALIKKLEEDLDEVRKFLEEEGK